MHFSTNKVPLFRTVNFAGDEEEDEDTWKYITGRCANQIALVDPKDVFRLEGATVPMVDAYKKYLKDNRTFGEIALCLEENDLKSLYRSNVTSEHQTADIRELYGDANAFFGGMIAAVDVFRSQKNGVPIYNKHIDDTIMKLMCKFL